MTKFTIDFTTSEKRKLWKAKISLRRLDDCSLNDILKAVEPNNERRKQIRRQFFEYGSEGLLDKGLASIMGIKPFGQEFFNKGIFGISSGMQTMLDMVNRNDKRYGENLRGLTGALEIARSSQSILDTFKPIHERLGLDTAMEPLRKTIMPYTITGLAALGENLNSHDKILGAVDSFLSQSLIHQEVFKKYEIGTLVSRLAMNTGFERAHMTGIGAALAATNALTDLAQRSLGSFAWDNLGRRNGLSELIVQTAQKEFLDVSAGYSALLRNINEKPNWIYESPETAKLPAQDYYIGSRILKIVSTEEFSTEKEDSEIDTENTDVIGRYLPVIDSDLPDIWKGALQAMHSDNPDRIRHMITSLRELYNHVLHRLAPDDELAKWDTDQTYYDKGRPTRRGRFMYICRNLEGSNSQFSKLLKTEIDATLAMIELFQGGTHSIKSDYAPHELEYIRIKAETTMRTFLSVEFEINRK